MKPPEVRVQADGRAGYAVMFCNVDGVPVEINRYGGGPDWDRQAVRIAGRQADAYAEGVRRGLVLAAIVAASVLNPNQKEK